MNAPKSAKSVLNRFLASALVISSTVAPHLAAAVDQMPADLPNFTDTVRVVEAKPVSGSVLAWDYMAADANGIQTAPGRVGNKEFEKSVFDAVGYIIKDGARVAGGSNDEIVKKVGEWQTEANAKGERIRVLEVEYDAHGGSGRAGHLKVPNSAGDYTWVNIKGIGVTGVGNTRGKNASPPQETSQSHGDGGAVDAEGFREFIFGLMAHNELKFGGSRIIGVLQTNMVKTVEDGRKEALAIIVREPIRRMDRSLQDSTYVEKTRIPRALGQANAKKIMKGDFVNQSNVGFDGTLIDYGLITHVNGIVPATNYLHVKMYRELDTFFKNDHQMQELYRSSIGFYLLNQLGFEEPRLESAAAKNPEAVLDMVKLAEAYEKLFTTENKVTRVDWDKWNKADINGNFRLHELFRTLLPDLLGRTGKRGPQLLEDIKKQARSLVKNPSPTFEGNLNLFLVRLMNNLDRILRAEPIPDYAKFVEGISKVAAFKNREIWDLQKENLHAKSMGLSETWLKVRDNTNTQMYLESVVNRNRLGTGHFTVPEMNVTADSEATYIHLKADVQKNGSHGLFLYPELPKAAKDQSYKFNIAFDFLRTPHEFEATLITKDGVKYYQIAVPHGKYPVTTELTRITPVLPGTAQASNVTIQGPPLFLNERLGLLPDLVQVKSVMNKRFGIRTGTFGEDFKRASSMMRACRDGFSAPSLGLGQ
jgi:hypothetical protein